MEWWLSSLWVSKLLSLTLWNKLLNGILNVIAFLHSSFRLSMRLFLNLIHWVRNHTRTVLWSCNFSETIWHCGLLISRYLSPTFSNSMHAQICIYACMWSDVPICCDSRFFSLFIYVSCIESSYQYWISLWEYCIILVIAFSATPIEGWQTEEGHYDWMCYFILFYFFRIGM